MLRRRALYFISTLTSSAGQGAEGDLLGGMAVAIRSVCHTTFMRHWAARSLSPGAEIRLTSCGSRPCGPW